MPEIKSIPRFSNDEVLDLQSILMDENVPCKFERADIGGNTSSRASEYYLTVEDEYYAHALSLMIVYFGFAPSDGTPYSGDCPACHAKVNAGLECPDCGLSFSPTISEAMKEHPFYKYLDQQNLLEPV